MKHMSTDSRLSAVAVAAVMSLGIFTGHLALREYQSGVELRRVLLAAEATRASLQQLALTRTAMDQEIQAVAVAVSDGTSPVQAAVSNHMNRIAALAAQQSAILQRIMQAAILPPKNPWWESVRCRAVRAGHTAALKRLQSDLAPLAASNSLLLKVLGHEA
jgi:hypothetical protein